LGNRTTHADALFRLGELAGARELFEAAEAIQKKDQPQYDLLYSLQGHRYCTLLLAAGEPREVERRARRTLEWEEQSPTSLLSTALDHLSLGRAALALAPSNPAAAAPDLQRAVDGLRHAGDQEHLIPGLLTRAELRRLELDLSAAERDLAEAAKLTRRSGFRLFDADVALERARLFVAQGRSDDARAALARAAELVEKMSYGLRRAEVERLREELGARHGSPVAPR
jgi:tetratricopeptide (TPR) repeat protein